MLEPFKIHLSRTGTERINFTKYEDTMPFLLHIQEQNMLIIFCQKTINTFNLKIETFLRGRTFFGRAFNTKAIAFRHFM